MKINCELQVFNMHNKIDELLRDEDSQVLSERELHTESFYISISSLSSMKWHAFEVVYALSAKWTQWLKNLFTYNEKFICEHIEFIHSAVTAFHLTSENFFSDHNKILFVMQFLAEEPWDAWFHHINENKLLNNKSWIFFLEFLLNLIENSVNCELSTVQKYLKVMQKFI